MAPYPRSSASVFSLVVSFFHVLQPARGRQLAATAIHATACHEPPVRGLLAHGLLRPQHGRIRWRGQPIGYGRRELAALRQRVGLVFQNPEHQLVATTVAEDLSYGLVNLGLEEGEIRRRIQAVIDSFDLGELLDRPVHMLSLG